MSDTRLDAFFARLVQKAPKRNWRLMRREEREEYEKALYARFYRQYDEQYARVGAKRECSPTIPAAQKGFGT